MERWSKEYSVFYVTQLDRDSCIRTVSEIVSLTQNALYFWRSHESVSYRLLVTRRLYLFKFALLDGRPIFGATRHSMGRLDLVDIHRVRTGQVVHGIRR